MEEKAVKPKIALFEFSSCEGCQLTVLNCEDEILGLLGRIEIVNFREAMSKPRENSYDIAFVEGSITRDSEIPRLQKIRETAKVLVALGSCAHIGCVNVYKNRVPEEDNRKIVYGECGFFTDTIRARPLSEVVRVDYSLPGCPISKKEFLEFVKAILAGRKPFLPDTAVCTHCKLLENGCLLLKGVPCLGPVTRTGCEAICPSYGSACWGCRGTYPDANFEGHRIALKEQGIPMKDMDRLYDIFQYSIPEELDQ